MQLITGYTGTPHIKSSDDALMYAFLSGKGNTVISASESHTNSSIDIYICNVLINGRLAVLRESESFELSSPGAGYYRKDVIYAWYHAGMTGTETAELVYQAGTSVNSDSAVTPVPSPPSGYYYSNYTTVYVLDWEGTTLRSVEHVQPYTLIETNNVDIKLLFNAGSASSDVVGSATEYTVPIHGNTSIVFGIGSFTHAMAAGKNYGFQVDTDRTNLITGGVQIKATGSGWGSYQIYTQMDSSTVRVGVHTEGASSGGTINYWYLESTDIGTL